MSVMEDARTRFLALKQRNSELGLDLLPKVAPNHRRTDPPTVEERSSRKQREVIRRADSGLYGPDYRAVRGQLALVIDKVGGYCMEEICVHPDRRIEIGAEWQLAHDHGRGGPTDLRGPAHPECNLDEMHRRKRLEKKKEQVAEKLAAIALVHNAPRAVA